MKLPILVFAQIFALAFSPLWIFVSVMSPLALPHTARTISDPAAYLAFFLFNATQVLIIFFSIALWISYFCKMPVLQRISAGFLFLSPLPLFFIFSM
jgi:hypothetical protein